MKSEETISRTGRQRYPKHQHHYSYNGSQAKKGALIGTWTRIDNSTMEEKDLFEAVWTKIMELKTLKFPLKKVMGTLTHMHRKTGDLKRNVILEKCNCVATVQRPGYPEEETER